jgi:hypothetical protein
MKRYIQHIKSKPPHDRRQHAMQLSAGVVAIVFVVWISTIGIRFASSPSEVAEGSGSQLANIISGAGAQNATLIVSTTSQDY